MKQKKQPVGVFTGLATLDLIHLVDSFPEQSKKADSLEMSVSAGGPAANAAVAFAACGGKSVLVTKLSRDHIGEIIIKDLSRYGVEIVDYGDTDTVGVVSSIIVEKETGDRTVVSNPEVASDEDSESFFCDKDLDFHKAVYEKYNPDVSLMDSYHIDLSRKAAWSANSMDSTMILDCGRERPWTTGQLKYVDIPIVSREFCGERSLFQTAEYLQGHACSHGVITNGEGAITFWYPDTEGQEDRRDFTLRQVMPEKVDRPVDTLGAGDIFHGAFAYSEALNSCAEDTERFNNNIRFASKAAGLSVQSLGTRRWIDDFQGKL